MNYFSKIALNTLKVSLLCGISFTVADQTMAGALWDRAVDEMRDTTAGSITKLKNLCTIKNIELKGKNRNKWDGRLRKIADVEGNMQTYFKLESAKAYLHEKTNYKSKKPVSGRYYQKPLGETTSRNTAFTLLESGKDGNLPYGRSVSPNAQSPHALYKKEDARVDFIRLAFETGNGEKSQRAALRVAEQEQEEDSELLAALLMSEGEVGLSEELVARLAAEDFNEMEAGYLAARIAGEDEESEEKAAKLQAEFSKEASEKAAAKLQAKFRREAEAKDKESEAVAEKLQAKFRREAEAKDKESETLVVRSHLEGQIIELEVNLATLKEMDVADEDLKDLMKELNELRDQLRKFNEENKPSENTTTTTTTVNAINPNQGEIDSLQFLLDQEEISEEEFAALVSTLMN